MTLEVCQAGAVRTLTLNRPMVHNALDEGLIAALHNQFIELSSDRSVRVVIIKGAGSNFCSGADLSGMERTAALTPDESRADAAQFCEMLVAFDQLPQATVCIAQGAAMAGALGLVCAADIALAAEGATFGLLEVRLGLVAAIIAPFVIRAIGARESRRWFLTGTQFDAVTAQRLGIVHEVVPEGSLTALMDTIVSELLQGGPEAVTETKRIIDLVASSPQGGSFVAGATVQASAGRRVSAEGKEGIAACLGKRRPAWLLPSG